MLLITSFYQTPWGMLKVEHDEQFIYKSFLTNTNGNIANNVLARLIENELKRYIDNSQHSFKLPLKPQGSPFQINVCNALLSIPAGQTSTYGELAIKLQTSPRAIGQACKRNPITLFIPCHRVLGKNNIGGYMGNPDAISYKESLLKHERIEIFQDMPDIK